MKNYSDFSDRELVEMTLVGDTDAFGELVTRHGPAVLNAARAVTRNPYAAEDAAAVKKTPPNHSAKSKQEVR